MADTAHRRSEMKSHKANKELPEKSLITLLQANMDVPNVQQVGLCYFHSFHNVSYRPIIQPIIIIVINIVILPIIVFNERAQLQACIPEDQPHSTRVLNCDKAAVVVR